MLPPLTRLFVSLLKVVLRQVGFYFLQHGTSVYGVNFGSVSLEKRILNTPLVVQLVSLNIRDLQSCFGRPISFGN